MDNQSREQGYFPASFFRRTDRLLLNDAGFHYRVRKGQNIGPFSSAKDANKDLSVYIKSLATNQSFTAHHNS